MQVQYRYAGFHSPLAEVFLGELSAGERSLFKEPLKRFESASLLSSFEDALLVFPFKVEDIHLPKLERVHAYIRQLAIGQIGEELLFRSSNAGKDSLPAAIAMLEALSKGAASQLNEKQLVITLNKSELDKKT